MVGITRSKVFLLILDIIVIIMIIMIILVYAFKNQQLGYKPCIYNGYGRVQEWGSTSKWFVLMQKMMMNHRDFGILP